MNRKRAYRRDEPDLPLPAIAHSVGYQTDAAFCKSFKRQFGTSPGAYRRSSNGLLLGDHPEPPGFKERYFARVQAYTAGYDREIGNLRDKVKEGKKDL